MNALPWPPMIPKLRRYAKSRGASNSDGHQPGSPDSSLVRTLRLACSSGLAFASVSSAPGSQLRARCFALGALHGFDETAVLQTYWSIRLPKCGFEAKPSARHACRTGHDAGLNGTPGPSVVESIASDEARDRVHSIHSRANRKGEYERSDQANRAAQANVQSLAEAAALNVEFTNVTSL
jgi:hypothetical protein